MVRITGNLYSLNNNRIVLQAKNAELDAKNRHLEMKMSVLWEERDNIGKETKQYQTPTNGIMTKSKFGHDRCRPPG